MAKIPQQQHYAALVFGTITIPGDERSRTNPGHGYPESTKETIEYVSFPSKEAMMNWVDQRGPYSNEYQLIDCKPLTVTKHVTHTIS